MFANFCAGVYKHLYQPLNPHCIPSSPASGHQSLVQALLGLLVCWLLTKVLCNPLAAVWLLDVVCRKHALHQYCHSCVRLL